MAAVESILVVTRRTPLEELTERFNSTAQARFYIEHAGGSFDQYEAQHAAYAEAVEALKRQLPRGVKSQAIERSFLPSYQFSGRDLVVPIGPDGLVINTAKYLTAEPILAINPDPSRVDGILIPFAVSEAREWIERALQGKAQVKRVSMARAALNDGHTLYAVNDLFIGVRSHISARYRIELAGQAENHSSSGIIVSTGAGCTGWLQSVVTGAARISQALGLTVDEPPEPADYRLDWDSGALYFSVREPFTSKTSSANIVFGRIEPGQELVLHSHMPENGIIFSDGIEADYLDFNSGAIASIGLAERQAHLIVRA
jgi:NAD kinase